MHALPVGLFVLVLLFLVNQYRRHLQKTIKESQEELLQEVKTLRADVGDRKLSLSLNSPFKPVSELVNHLSAVRERQSRQLTEHHHHQQVLLNNMSEGILVLDNDQRITGINPTAARWLDLGNAVRAQGEVFYTLCRNPSLLQLIEELTSSQVSFKEIYLRLERPEMEDRVVRVKGSLLVDHDQTMGVLLLLQDVTTLQRLETLRQDFVANVSHELRTPLTAIKGYAELISDEPEDAETVATFTEKILKQSTRMVNIIDDLLSLTRIESSEAKTSLQITELRPILEQVIQLCEEQAQARQINISLFCDEHIRAELHPALFEQALYNLTNNAIKYTHPSTEIQLKVFPRPHEIRIEVIDHGPGIPPADLPRIFERFYRVDKARSRAVGGTGLGLSIVKHIAILHQGKVGVDSIPGKGTTFWLCLPAVTDPTE
ncbi:ATP-binding protein [Kiritimatiellaeota bacterium B1221]|nr:ATP-binding protein [Kiritimatiellaeota bacterium B1221]